MKNATPEALLNRYLGINIAMGLAGLAHLALFIVLGRVVAAKQSVIMQAMETHEFLHESAQPASAKV